MTTTNDGGPAFPDPNLRYPHPGMALRDWFAGQALAGSLAREEVADSGDDEWWEAAVVASMCYQLADAMLAERAKERKP